MDSTTTTVKSADWTYFPEYKRYMKETAQNIRWKCRFEDPPYDPYLIAEKMGVRVREEPLSGVDGYVQAVGKGWEAVVSMVPQEERRRFTLAHELGHVVLLKAADAGYARSLMRFRVVGFRPELHQDPMEEALCNAFASELLVPSDDINKRLSDGLKLPRDIPRLASEFHISLHAAATAVVNLLGPKRTALSLWRKDSLWPLPVWWVGVKTKRRAERSKLESLVGKLVGKRDQVTCQWDSFNVRKRPASIRVAPISRKLALVYVTLAAGRNERWQRTLSPLRPKDTATQLTLFEE